LPKRAEWAKWGGILWIASRESKPSSENPVHQILIRVALSTGYRYIWHVFANTLKTHYDKISGGIAISSALLSLRLHKN